MPTKRRSTAHSASPAALAQPSSDELCNAVQFPLVLPYGAGPGRESLAPILELELVGPKGQLRDAALIDTGADTSAFPVHWMKHLGILKKDCLRRRFETAGGPGTQWHYPGGLEATILGLKLRLTATFVDCPVALLGREDFLEAFRVSFDQRHRRFTIEPY